MEDLEERKAKTHKGKLFLDSKRPKEIEGPKQCLFINTNKSSEIMKMILEDLVRKIFYFFSSYLENIILKN